MSLNLPYRIELLARLGSYMAENGEEWQRAKDEAFRANNWFIPQFIDYSVAAITRTFLRPEQLKAFAAQYALSERDIVPNKVGIVMAGNLPLVGFHDLLAVFITGHLAVIKLSSKDEILLKHLINKLIEWESGAAAYFTIQPLLKGCDAYIATGSNNSSRYFDYYFQKYPHIIRKNRTSAAILTGEETGAQLEALADDVHLYFGMGCRSVTKLFVPRDYDFIPLLAAFDKYSFLSNHHKYKNNYDHNLALHILNNQYYMTNGTTLLIENNSPFSPISQVHYGFYNDINEAWKSLENNSAIQCVVDNKAMTFGHTQQPSLTDFADGADTMKFLVDLRKEAGVNELRRS